MGAIKLSPFTKNDWYDNAGAMPAADGREPVIGSNGTGLVEVLADNQGIEVRLYKEEDGEVVAMDVWSREGESQYDVNVGLASGMAAFDTDTLSRMGFDLIHTETF